MTQMNFNNVMKVNRVKVVGPITALNIIDDFDRNQTPIKRGSVTVKVGDSELVLELYMAETYKSGKENSSYKILEGATIGSVFTYDCNLNESKFVPRDGSGELARSYKIRVNFVNKTRNTDVEGATFEYGGIVLSQLKEMTNQEGEVYRLDIMIGQPEDYTDRGLNIFRFNVDPRNTELIQAVRDNFNTLDTVKISGTIVAETTTTEVIEESLFGAPVTKTYQNNFVSYNITGAAVVPENNIYSEEQINHLMQATKEYDATLKAEATAAPKKAAKTAKTVDPLGWFEQGGIGNGFA